MALTPAQKQKRYRENLKAKGLQQTMKAKNADRMKTFRRNLNSEVKEKYDKKHAESQQNYRDKKKNKFEYVSHRLIAYHKTSIYF